MSRPADPACLFPSDRSPVRPAPKRLLSLQPQPNYRPLTPLKSTPIDYEYPSPTSPTSPFRPTTSQSRPGAPQRAHSFCGDLSASTYALASAKSGTHLTGDKSNLIAPPLERTLSSLGSRGNCTPKGQLMARPLTRDSSGHLPLTPPISPLRTTTPVPKILISSASPTRPPLDPMRAPLTSPSHTDTRRRHCGIPPALPPYPSSYAAFTPTASPCIGSVDPLYPVGMPLPAHLDSCGNMTPEAPVAEDDDDDLMVVDEMIERVEDLVV